MSISFSTLEKRHCGDDLGNYGTNSNFECSDFIVATDKAKII